MSAPVLLSWRGRWAREGGVHYFFPSLFQLICQRALHWVQLLSPPMMQPLLNYSYYSSVNRFHTPSCMVVAAALEAQRMTRWTRLKPFCQKWTTLRLDRTAWPSSWRTSNCKASVLALPYNFAPVTSLCSIGRFIQRVRCCLKIISSYVHAGRFCVEM